MPAFTACGGGARRAPLLAASRVGRSLLVAAALDVICWACLPRCPCLRGPPAHATRRLRAGCAAAFAGAGVLALVLACRLPPANGQALCGTASGTPGPGPMNFHRRPSTHSGLCSAGHAPGCASAARASGREKRWAGEAHQKPAVRGTNTHKCVRARVKQNIPKSKII